MNAFSPSQFNASSLSSLFNPDDLVPNPVQYPIYHIQRPTIIHGFKDSYLALLTPVAAYWAYSLFFYILDSDIFQWPSKYRIHESEEVKSKNLASPRDVFFAVILQHVVQTALGVFWLEDSVSPNHPREMRRLSTQLCWFTIKILGEKRANTVLRLVGPQLIPWLYWWGIPIIQFLFAV